MKNFEDFSGINHHQYQDQDNLKKRIRYSTPQPLNSFSEELDFIGDSFSKSKIVEGSNSRKRDTRHDSSEQKSGIATCLKGLFEPSRMVQGVLRTQSLLRQCYAPKTGYERPVEISPSSQTTNKRRLPELPAKNLTTERYHSGTHNILKQFSSLSRASAQSGNVLGLPKVTKQRPKLDAMIDQKKDSDLELHDSDGLPPAVVSRAEAEEKNFLYDMYLRKAEECLEEFENKKEAWSLSECLRQLDRCIEFYELSLKTLSGDRDFENSRILLRTKQSKVILKKRNTWNVKTAGSARMRDGHVTERHGVSCGNDCRVDGRNTDTIQSRGLQSVADRGILRRDTNTVPRHEPMPRSRTQSATSFGFASAFSSGDSHTRYQDWSINKRYSTGTVMPNDSRQPEKMRISLEPNDVQTSGNLRNKSASACNNYFSAKAIPNARAFTNDNVRKRFPPIPEHKNHSYVDITSRAGDRPLVKISLV